jgi:hypothetical protein
MISLLIDTRKAVLLHRLSPLAKGSKQPAVQVEVD